MTAAGWLQIAALFAVVLALTRPIGSYLYRVLESEHRPLPRVERAALRLLGLRAPAQQTWGQYTRAMLLFSACGLAATFAILRLQHVLPLDPQHFRSVPNALAFNTAASFTTNTNWQAYAGEQTMSHLSQMAGLAWHNFTSAAVGIGVALALARGITRRTTGNTIGNFYVDIVRAILYVLLPASFVIALVLVSQGVIQTLAPYHELTTVEGAVQTLALGPVASQEAIKELGTNGGGFFNANSAHPFENPTPLTNFLEMVLILAIPAGLTYAYGKMARDTRQGGVLFAAMSVLFVAGVTVAYGAESHGNAAMAGLHVSGVNMEGKETRFGAAGSALFATVTTDASCGAVNASHDSFTPLGGMVPLVNIQLGEIVFGGVGAGLYGVLVFALHDRVRRRADGRSHAGVPRQEDRAARDDARDAVRAGVPADRARLHRVGVGRELRHVAAVEPRRARAVGDALRVHERGGQQRLGVRRPRREHRLLEHRARHRDARRSVPDDRAGDGDRGRDGEQADRRTRARHVPDARRAVRRAARRGDRHRRRADLRARAVARADRRALSSRASRGDVVAKHGRPEVAMFDAAIVRAALRDSVRKLDPRHLAKNPVMFVVAVGSLLVTALTIRDLATAGTPSDPRWFSIAIALWLWFTVLFANFAEAVAEGRGKAQADTLRRMRQETVANRLVGGAVEIVPASQLRRGDRVVVDAGQLIPGDGEVIDGIASVDESAITGESAPVIRESGGDRSSVTGGTKVLSDRIVVAIGANPEAWSSFLDKMISLVEGAARQKTPNEIALHILLVGLTLVFLIATVTLVPMSIYSGVHLSTAMIVSLLVCLIPTTIGGLLSAIGIAGMDRLMRKNVIAMSGRAVEAAGDVDVLLLDKTGTITLGNRGAHELIPAADVRVEELAEAALLASLADETPEGRSIVALIRDTYALPPHSVTHACFVKFSAHTRMSGLDDGDRRIRKGALDAIAAYACAMPADVRAAADRIGDAGGTPLAVCDGSRVLGLVHLKDVVKPGIRERFTRFRAMGIRTVMISGDNPRTAKGDRERGRRRRLSRRGDAGGRRDGLDRGRAGEGKARRDDR